MDQELNLDDLPPEMAEMIPEEVRDAMLAEKLKRLEQVEAIGQAISQKRDEAVNGRAGSGIEKEWQEDEDAYQGLDEVNRGDSQTYKPLSHTGSAVLPRKEGSRSTVFLNITRPYTDAASARVADMLLPTDDKNWAIRPTPIPQIEELAKLGQQQAMPPTPVPPAGIAAPPGMSAAPDQIAMAVQQATQVMDGAKKKAEAAEKQIDDWLVECQWHAEMRKVIEDCARLGTGIMKGPFPAKRKTRRVVQTPEGMGLAIDVEIVPESKHIDPWKLYPDPNCGESIHNGQYVFERDDITARQLKDLKGLPGYIGEMIDKVLEEGPGKKHAGTNQKCSDDDTYEIWYYTGFLDRDDLEVLGVDLEDKRDDSIPAIVTLVNDCAIKASLNPLDAGDFPYDVMPWQRRQNAPWGVGVARQIRTPQRMINAATRNMMDNAGLAGGPQIVLRRNAIEPADGTWTLAPRKFWFAKEDADVRAVQDSILAINIPSMQPQLMEIINFAMKMAEDVTGLPMLLQGQLGKAPDTVGGMQMLTNNANSVLRRIARGYDDCITEPHIRRYYDWIMQYGPDECKGDFTIDARGSTALVERDIQNQQIMQMGQLVMNPAFGLSPSKWIKEALLAQRLDPRKFELDEQEKQAMAQRPPPEAPQVAVAKIRAQTDMQKTQMQLQADMEMAKMDSDRDLLYAQAQAEKVRVDAMSRREELILKREIAYLTAQVQKGIEVDSNKVRLAETAAKLRTQKELSLLSMRADAYKHVTPKAASPAVEPAGRAAPGKGFQQ